MNQLSQKCLTHSNNFALYYKNTVIVLIKSVFLPADMNDVFITGTLVGETIPLTQGNGVTFLLDTCHFGRYGMISTF